MSNNIFYDPYNEIRCDRFALEKFVKESEAKDQRIAELEELLKNARKEVCEDLYNKCVEKIWTNDEGFDCVDIDNIKEILDQIQGQTNDN